MRCRGSYKRITSSTHRPNIVSGRTLLPLTGSEKTMIRYISGRTILVALSGAVVSVIFAAGVWVVAAQRGGHEGRLSGFLNFSAPAGNRPATTNTTIDGVKVAVLPNGRLLTPAGVEVNVQAPKPFGMALSRNGQVLATLNSGAGPFSLTLITQLSSTIPAVKRINVSA